MHNGGGLVQTPLFHFVSLLLIAFKFISLNLIAFIFQLVSSIELIRLEINSIASLALMIESIFQTNHNVNKKDNCQLVMMVKLVDCLRSTETET